MEKNKRGVTCGQLRLSDVGKSVTLNGWVHRSRNHGGLHFIGLRDRYGLTQIVFDEEASEELKNLITSLKMEYCIAVIGLVRARPEGMSNSEMETGAIEVHAQTLEILNTCPALPFMIDGDTEINENLRLKYRYLDLRSRAMRHRLKMRHDATWATRNYLVEKDFWEIETPTLIKSTPEGARDYLVPSRINQGFFYALPQSPQLYKQILMAGGTDRYYQFARCYRDEDSRGDRQPEFTQIDLEMSFVNREDILVLIEGMMRHVFQKVLDTTLPDSFPRLSWKEALDSYGSDKPDLRFDLKIQDFSPYVPDSDFSLFQTVLNEGAVVKFIHVKGAAARYSRKKIAALEAIAQSRGAKGLAWFKVTPQGLDGGISKFFARQHTTIINNLKAKPDDLILLVGADWKTAVESLGALRTELAKELSLYRPDDFKFCWVLDFPLFEKNEETGTWDPAHHMFSMPQEAYLDTMENNPAEVLGNLYDLVLNGNEIASGSLRIHDPDIQRRIFDLVGFSKEEAQKRFGFLLEAFRYGAPPHGGIAVGFDRLLMVMAQVESIRDVIAFPKNTQGISPMDGSPTPVDNQQLADLNLEIRS